MTRAEEYVADAILFHLAKLDPMRQMPSIEVPQQADEPSRFVVTVGTADVEAAREGARRNLPMGVKVDVKAAGQEGT